MGEVLKEMKIKISPKPKKKPSPAKKSVRQLYPKVPTCDECGKSFITNAHLMKHAKVHRTAEEPPQLRTCEICGLNFREEYNLITHWRSGRCAKLKGEIEKKQLDRMNVLELKKAAKSISEKGKNEMKKEKVSVRTRGRAAKGMVDIDVE